MHSWIWLLAGLVALVLTLAGVPIAGKLAWWLDAIDQPGPRKIHTRPVPRLGGMAIFGAAALTLGFFLEPKVIREGLAIMMAGALVAFVGFLDDMGRLHSQIKLFFAMPLAACILISSGIHAAVTPWAAANYGVTLLWVIGIICAFNLLDGLDGLAAGVAAIASVGFLILAAISRQALTALLAATTLGISLGFVVYNFHPAHIFMGDGGAMFLGLLMAVLGMKVRLVGPPASVDWMLPIIILGVPIFDTALVTVSRIRRGLIPFASPGKDHTFHRLYLLGWSQRRIVMVLYGFAALFGAMAVSLVLLRVPQAVWILTAGALTLGAIAAIVLFERLPFERGAGMKWADVRLTKT